MTYNFKPHGSKNAYKLNKILSELNVNTTGGPISKGYRNFGAKEERKEAHSALAVNKLVKNGDSKLGALRISQIGHNMNHRQDHKVAGRFASTKKIPFI